MRFKPDSVRIYQADNSNRNIEYFASQPALTARHCVKSELGAKYGIQ